MLCEGWDSDVVANRREVSASLWKEIRAKESFLAQKSRARWIKEGDMNSKYFHSLMRYRRRRCSVVILRDNGEQVEEVDAVKFFVKQHFEKCFSEANHNRPLLGGLQFKRLTSSHADSLIQPFTEEEIRMGVWECDGDKSPGPDGFNLNFIKSGWSFMKEDVVGFFNEFFANAFLPKAISASFIALVPKNDNPQGLGEFRPICLIGCIYKILAKVLASRLKKVMPSIISHHQSAFIGGRQILDGVVVANELVDYAKRSKEECMLFKVDFEKAYDSISWNFLFYMLTRMGFPQRWIAWIKSCVCTSSMSVLVNGSPTQDFKVQRGLRQGDPLSPFLFLIVAEALSVLMMKAVDIGDYQGFSFNEDLNFSILQFADDTMFVGKASWANLWSIKSILRSFELVSGLKVNFHKSKLIGIHTPDGFLERASTFLFCRTESIPFKFLGIPIGANPRREATWSYVLRAVRKRLSLWKGRFLSIGGRVTLINSVLNSMPLYMFSFYKAPKVVIKKMVKIQRDFLWGIKEGERGMCWVAWDSICKPKEEGGLGIKNLELFNIALLSKWKWRALSDPCVSWSRMLSCRYGDLASSLVQDLVEGNRRRDTGSIWWRDLVNLDVNVEEQRRFAWCVRRGLGDGASINFWKDQWLGIDPLFKVFPLLYNGVGQQNLTVAESGVWHNDSWRWLEPWHLGNDAVRTAEADILRDILQPVAPTRMKMDSWIWPLDQSKNYSVKTFYIQLVRGDLSSNVSVQQNFFAGLWKSIVPSKVLVFGWRLLLDALPVREQLLRRNVLHLEDDARCSFCHVQRESVNHLFLHCGFANSVWKCVTSWIGVDLDLSLDVVGLVHHCCCLCKGKKAKRTKHVVWLTTCWSIWLARNGAIFNNEEPNIEMVVNRIKSLSWCWCIYRLNCNSSFSISMWWSNPLQCLNNL